MGYGTFFLHFLTEDFVRNVVIYSFLLLLFFKCFHKYLYSLFDPFVTTFILPVVCCCSIILWLWTKKYIEFIIFFKLFVYFLFFLFGFFYGKKVCVNTKSVYATENYNFFKIFYIVHFAFLCGLFILYLKKIGFSNWDDKIASRQGNGLIIYLNNYFPFVSFLLVKIKEIKFRKKTISNYIIYFLIIFLKLLSGSKGAVISLFSWFFVIPLLIKKICLNEKSTIKLFSGKILLVVFFSVFSMCIAILIVNNNPTKLLADFLLHFFEFGDIYYLSLPKNIYENLSHHSLIKFIFYSLIGPLYRFMPVAPDSPIGFEIIDIVYKKTGSTTGPNSRFFYMLLISGYKVLPYIFSMLLGFLMIYIRKCKLLNGSIFGFVASVFLFFTFPTSITDFGLFGLNFFALLVLLPFTYFLTVLLLISANYKLYRNRTI